MPRIASRQHRENVGALVARLLNFVCQNNDLEMEYIKLEMFGAEGGAPIMANGEASVLEQHCICSGINEGAGTGCFRLAPR